MDPALVSRAMEHVKLFLRVFEVHFPDRIITWYLGCLLSKTIVWNAKECNRVSAKSVLEVLNENKIAVSGQQRT